MPGADFAAPLSSAIEAFGEEGILYEAGAAPPITLPKAIFDRHHIFTREGDSGVPVSVRLAALTVRLSDFAGGPEPAAGDRVMLPPKLGNLLYDVADVQPDGFGAAILPLTRAT